MRNILVVSFIFMLFGISVMGLQAQDMQEATLAEIAARGEVTVDYSILDQVILEVSLTESAALGLATINYNDAAALELAELEAAGLINIARPA